MGEKGEGQVNKCGIKYVVNKLQARMDHSVLKISLFLLLTCINVTGNTGENKKGLLPLRL